MMQSMSAHSVVMRGLDPRIHLFQEKMDCRVKPGNDEQTASVAS